MDVPDNAPPNGGSRRTPPQPAATASRSGEAGNDEARSRLLTAIELKVLMREVAQVVKRPDVGPLLAKVGAEDPLGDDDGVPKRKRITAALIATDHREPDRGWIERLIAAVEAYDEIEYVARIERVAEHVVELDRVRQVAPRIPAWTGDDRDVSAHDGLTYWGGSGRIARNAVLLVRECNRETQIELDAAGTAAVLAGLSRARQQLEESDRYLQQRQQRRGAPC